MEKVSVIIPVYNNEKYLNQCVESVLKQTYTNLEIILIDDGSTDRTPEICEHLREQDPRIRVFHKENGGIGSSRNSGLTLASGDYILFVDSDDWIEPDCIKTLYNQLKTNNADIAIGNFMRFDEETAVTYFQTTKNDYFEKTYTPVEWFKHEYDSKFNLFTVFVVPWGKLYKRSLFKNIVYSIDNKVEDDSTTWKIYLLADKISYINCPIYTYRLVKSSITNTIDRTKLYPLESVTERLALLKTIGVDTVAEEDAYLFRLKVLREDALKNGNFTKYRDAGQKLAILKKFKKI